MNIDPDTGLIEDEVIPLAEDVTTVSLRVRVHDALNPVEAVRMAVAELIMLGTDNALFYVKNGEDDFGVVGESVFHGPTLLQVQQAQADAAAADEDDEGDDEQEVDG